MNAEGPGRTQDQDGEADSRPGQRSPSTEWGRFVTYLLESGIGPDRFIKAKPGTKRPAGQWDTHQPGDVDRDSLIKTGDGLLIVDIDDWRETPQSIRDLLTSTPTLTVQSPHAKGKEGHYYYQLDSTPFSKNERCFEWGEVKYGALTVTPGSEIHGIRGGQDCSKGCCSPESPGHYTIRESRPIRLITVDVLGDALGTNPESEEPDTTTIRWNDGTPDDYEAVDLPEDYDGQTVTNDFGMTVKQVREVSTTIDRLCDAFNPGKEYTSPSEGDWKFAQLLLFWAFDTEEVNQLIRYFRSREKIKRRDNYVDMTVRNAERHIHDRIDASLGWALWGSCDEVGPAAGYDTLLIVDGIMAWRPEWTSTQALTEETKTLSYRQLLRGLHILADADRIDRRGTALLEWRNDDPGQPVPMPPSYNPEDL